MNLYLRNKLNEYIKENWRVETEMVPNLTIEQYAEIKETLADASSNYEEIKDDFIFDDSTRSYVYIMDKFLESEVSDLSHQESLYYPLCSKNEIRRIVNPKNSDDYLLKYRAYQIVGYTRLHKVITKIRKEMEEAWHFQITFQLIILKPTFECYLLNIAENVNLYYRNNLLKPC